MHVLHFRPFELVPAFGNPNSARFTGPLVYVLEQVLMNIFQVIVVEVPLDRVRNQLEGTYRGDFTLKVVERSSIGDSGFVAKGIGARN